jgi:hypothetical protein
VIGDYKVYVDEAKAFLRVAEFCSENIDKLLDVLMYPFGVNVSFSCELFLKAIMLHQSSTNECDKGHDLKKLYEKLDINIKNSIEGIYSKNGGNKPIDELLKEEGKSFIEWRYAYEHDVSMDVSDMIVFAKSLQEYTNQLK